MVGFPAKPPPTTIEQDLAAAAAAADQDLDKVKSFKDTLDFSSIDSFLDFDSSNWLVNNRNIEEFDIDDTDFAFFEHPMEIPQEKSELSDEIGVSSVSSESLIEEKLELCDGVSEDVSANKCETTIEEESPKVCDDDKAANVNGVAEQGLKEPVEDETVSVCNTMNLDENIDGVAEPGMRESEPKVVEGETVMNLDEPELKKTDEGLASSIEVGLEKVSLTVDDDEKSDGDKEKTNAAVSESDSSSSSSSGSDSSSSEEEESDEEESEEEDSDEKETHTKDQMVLGKEAEMAGELEEGEIGSVDEEHEGGEIDDEDDDDDDVNEMIAWSNDEDEDLGPTKEPIRSKNELKELPPVPAVEVTLEPHHVTLPVGVVLSVMSTQVIVEGVEKHSPLTEGSILWITERRTPLGLVDEIFGPVKCPYYIVRFNSESEVPEGISQGTSISFVADFAQHILNIKELQEKGYDASGNNDEEIADELEFSDDEKEAEYRRMQKMEKRGITNDQTAGNERNKKKKNRDRGRSGSSYSGEWAENNHGTSSLSSNRSDPQKGGPFPNHQPRPQMDGFRPNSGAWRPQSSQFQLPPMPNQMGMPNLGPMQIPFMAMQNQNPMMFQPQFNGGQMPMPGGPGGLNFFPGPPLFGQNCFNQQPFGMGRGIQLPQIPNDLNFNPFASQGFQMHPQQPPMNPQFQMQPQFQMMNRPPQSPVMQPPQSEMRPQSQIPQSPTTSNPQPQLQPQSQEFSTGNYSERGRGHRGRGRGRGRGRFGRGRGRGRGRQQSE